jgi:hypothetical protein
MARAQAATLSFTIGFDDTIAAFSQGTIRDSDFIAAAEAELIEKAKMVASDARERIARGGSVFVLIKAPTVDIARRAKNAALFDTMTPPISFLYGLVADTIGCPPTLMAPATENKIDD